MPIQMLQTIPILRIFDVDKAKAFYVDFLGFQIDWEHRFDVSSPLYMQVSRARLTLHLSEHHGDACPGSTVFVFFAGCMTREDIAFVLLGALSAWAASVAGIVFGIRGALPIRDRAEFALAGLFLNFVTGLIPFLLFTFGGGVC